MHIPSSLSHLYYLDYIFTNNLISKNWNIIIGKPFGAYAYYYIWSKLGWLDSTKKYSYGIKHEEIDFVDFSEETLGNALGVASGIEIGNGKQTWVNLSDASLEMGPTMEAIKFIGRYNQNIKVTIDFNKMKLTSELFLTTKGIRQLFENNGWWFFEIKTKKDFYKLGNLLNTSGPVCILIHTKKGDGVKEMEKDPIEWHYKSLTDLNKIHIMDSLCKDFLQFVLDKHK